MHKFNQKLFHRIVGPNRIVIAKRKHGDTYHALFDYPTAIESFWKILNTNIECQYYFDKDLDKVNDIISRKDVEAAVEWLFSRRDYEYEELQFEELT